MTLYELNEQYRELLYQIENGEIPEEAITDTLNLVEGELKDKLDNYAIFIKQLNADAEAIKQEAKNLTERAKRNTNLAERLKLYMSDIMTVNNIDKLETPRNVIKFIKSSSVRVGDEFINWASEYAEDLLKFKAPEPDKTAIKAAIKDGRVPEEIATIIENRNINIK